VSVVAALRGVQVTYPSPTGPVEALRGVDLELLGGTATAIVGR
jgi:ABC-type glutathione transport system ATPase component